jgi:hypothetical protein
VVLVSLSDREEEALVRAPARQWGAQGELVWFDVVSGQRASVTPVGADGWDVRLAPCQVVLGRWRAQTASVVLQREMEDRLRRDGIEGWR